MNTLAFQMAKKAGMVFLLALLTRLLYFGFFPPRSIQLDDAESWDGIAWNLAEGRGFLDANGLPTSVRPPVYPLFLAGIYKVFGHSYPAAKLAQILLSALTCALLFLIGSRVFGEKLGFISGLVCAFYPPLIVYSVIIGSETLYAFLLECLLMIS